nr:cucumber peeling cupredoxin-like [Tanacetum cinerariifolium]
MAWFNLNLFVFIAMMAASTHFLSSTAQTTHVVGDALGWTIPQGGAAAYTTWASQQTFTVGDILVFNYANVQHDVAEVAEAAYGPCTSNNPISLATTSPTSLTLTTPGREF